MLLESVGSCKSYLHLSFYKNNLKSKVKMNKYNYDYITPIKDQLDKHMETHCAMFVTIGNGRSESPRWYNFRDYDLSTKQLTIGSTQRSHLFFDVDCKHLNIKRIDASEFWPQFKEYRTNFLKTNFKTIDRV